VEAGRMRNIKYNDEMDLTYMLIDLTGIRKAVPSPLVAPIVLL
jgi:hypothetical protein